MKEKVERIGAAVTLVVYEIGTTLMVYEIGTRKC